MSDEQQTFKNPFGSDKEAEQPKASSSTGGPADAFNERHLSGPKVKDLKSSRAYSVSSPAWNRERKPSKWSNPSAIPTAGGQALGARATEERRKSRVSNEIASPGADRPGSPYAPTQENTTVNAVPASTDSGEGGSKTTEDTGKTEESYVAPAAASPTVPDVKVTDSTNEADGARADSKADAVKESEAAKEEESKRKGSVLNKLFGKK